MIISPKSLKGTVACCPKKIHEMKRLSAAFVFNICPQGGI
tara:strand:+ start:330 stop:449 length:120 start_codon:yes stop_codon:yes gene_type:complete